MLEHGAKNYEDCLYEACYCGHSDIASLMLDRGAQSYNTCLNIACLHGYGDIIKLLIERGATECDCCHKSMEDHQIFYLIP